MWSRNYNKCINCGTVDIKHLARGLCRRCYWRESEQRHTSKNGQIGFASQKLTKEFLEEEYINKQRSFSEIAKDVGCKRQYICIKMAEYGIPKRTLADARAIALEKGKISVKYRDDSGKVRSTVFQKVVVNEDFFSSWRKDVAWVLGIVYTDGHIDPAKLDNPSRIGSNRTAYVSIAQKEPELLYKILRIMECNAKLTTIFGGVCGFTIHSNKIYNDLVNIGLKPHKSLNMRFPNIPSEYESHFIRGCWDGDGSVGIYQGAFRARFFCGSLKFIEELVRRLVNVGLPQRRIYVRYTKRGNPFYSIFYGGKDSVKLYEFLYKDTDSSRYLERKHELFKKAYDKFRAKIT